MNDKNVLECRERQDRIDEIAVERRIQEYREELENATSQEIQRRNAHHLEMLRKIDEDGDDELLLIEKTNSEEDEAHALKSRKMLKEAKTVKKREYDPVTSVTIENLEETCRELHNDVVRLELAATRTDAKDAETRAQLERALFDEVQCQEAADELERKRREQELRAELTESQHESVMDRIVEREEANREAGRMLVAARQDVRDLTQTGLFVLEQSQLLADNGNRRRINEIIDNVKSQIEDVSSFYRQVVGALNIPELSKIEKAMAAGRTALTRFMTHLKTIDRELTRMERLLNAFELNADKSGSVLRGAAVPLETHCAQTEQTTTYQKVIREIKRQIFDFTTPVGHIEAVFRYGTAVCEEQEEAFRKLSSDFFDKINAIELLGENHSTLRTNVLRQAEKRAARVTCGEGDDVVKETKLAVTN